MKYRTFPVVSFLVVFPALTFAGSDSGLSRTLGNLQNEPFAAGFARKGVQLAEYAPALKASNVQPVLEQTQKAELPEYFKGISATVSRYSNGRQKLTFELSDKNDQTLQPHQPTSGYLEQLLKMIEVVVNKGVEVWYDEKTSNFELSSESESIIAFNIKVPSRIITDNDPGGALPGFTALSKTALTDTIDALSCYANRHSVPLHGIVACGDGRYLSAKGSKNSYSYFITSSVLPQTTLFSQSNEQQFSAYKGRLLSDDDLYYLLIVNGQPVKVAAIGDIQNIEETTDTGTKTSSQNNKATHEGTQKKKPPSGLNPTGNRPESSKASGGQGGGDDPNKRRPTDYKPKPPGDSTAQKPKGKKTRKLEASIAEVDSKIGSIQKQLTKWRPKAGYGESDNFIRKKEQLKKLEEQRAELLQRLSQAEKEPTKQESPALLPRPKGNSKKRFTTNQLVSQAKADQAFYEETEAEEEQRQYEEYQRSPHTLLENPENYEEQRDTADRQEIPHFRYNNPRSQTIREWLPEENRSSSDEESTYSTEEDEESTYSTEEYEESTYSTEEDLDDLLEGVANLFGNEEGTGGNLNSQE